MSAESAGQQSPGRKPWEWDVRVDRALKGRKNCDHNFIYRRFAAPFL